MGNLITAQRVDNNGFYLRLGADMEYEISSANLKYLYDGYIAEEYTPEDARAAVITEVKAAISGEFGDSIDVDKMGFDFDTSTGIPSALASATTQEFLDELLEQ